MKGKKDGAKKPKAKATKKVAAKPQAKVMKQYKHIWQSGYYKNMKGLVYYYYGNILLKLQKKVVAAKRGGKNTSPGGSVDSLTLSTAIKIAKAVGYSKAARGEAINKVFMIQWLLYF